MSAIHEYVRSAFGGPTVSQPMYVSTTCSNVADIVLGHLALHVRIIITAGAIFLFFVWFTFTFGLLCLLRIIFRPNNYF